MTKRIVNPVVLAVAGAIALLVALPLTRSILRSQLYLPPRPVYSGDCLIELARAVKTSRDSDIVPNLRALIRRFPNRPEAKACLLIAEREQTPVMYPAPSAQLKTPYRKDAESAMKTDPSNVFFGRPIPKPSLPRGKTAKRSTRCKMRGAVRNGTTASLRSTWP